jgi:formate hydrogenlyase subunit 3/multisubunit Na+/H+ antiporter MnhD subunit
VNTTALAAAVYAPLLAAGALLPRATRPMARRLAPVAALPALLAGPSVGADAPIPWLLLGSRIGLDAVGAALLPPMAALWLVAGLFALRQIEPGPRGDRFFGCFLAAMSGNFILLAALDAVTFYLGFALMSFASYGLVVHAGDARARHAGRYYLAMVVLGEGCVIAGLLMLASGSSIDFAEMRAGLAGAEPARQAVVLVLLLVGFGIKAGVVGLHFWLPLAHPVAPAPASAVLSGAMIKAGLVAWMRFLPLGAAALPAWGAGIAAAGLVTAVYAVLVGLPQREAKTVLAYSSVSQMGVMIIAIGLGLAMPERWPLAQAALLVYIVHHGLLKGTLFLGAGMTHAALRPPAARAAALVFCLGAWSMAGGALGGGLVAKSGLKAAIPHAGPWHDWLAPLLVLSSALTALLLLRFLWLAWPRADEEAGHVPAWLMSAWLLLAATALSGPWWLAAPGVRAGAAAWIPGFQASVPLFLALLLALAAARWMRGPPARRLPAVPPGDVGIPLERALGVASHRLDHALRQDLPGLRAWLWRQAGTAGRALPACSARLGRAEDRVGAWSVTGVLLFLVLVLSAWLLS